jgi:ferritin-like metal-binding protein YciE
MTHREKTQGHIERLEQVFEMIGKRPQTKPCQAINGIVAEGEETVEGSARASRSIQVWLRRRPSGRTL